MTHNTSPGKLPFVHSTLHKALLFCGILSSLVYVFANIIAAILYEGYNAAAQTVSELSAIGAPTRTLWMLLLSIYSLLLIAFGWGIYKSGAANRLLRIIGSLFIAVAIIGFLWPPMHQREVLATDGGTLTDTMHIVFTAVWGIIAMITIGLGAAVFGKMFRLYSIATLIILIFFGILTGLDSPKMVADLPTPFMGVWERINIGAYMIWVVVLALMLLKGKNNDQQFFSGIPKNYQKKKNKAIAQ